jgi:DNA repair protein RecO
MKQITTTAIILSRTDFGEADRILTLLTPDRGKLRLMAKGVRRIKSKLAGGIELFSVSDIVFIQGRGDIGTLISTRLIKHYGHIVKDVTRTMLGYELIKVLNKATEDEPEADYFDLLEQAFAVLDDATIPLELIQLWFNAQLLKLSGHTPNLEITVSGNRLEAGSRYDFSYDDAAFTANPEGLFDANDIKFLRLLFSGNGPAILNKIGGAGELAGRTMQLVGFMRQQYLRS